MQKANRTFLYVGNWRAKPSNMNGFSIFQYDGPTAGLTFVGRALSDVIVGAAYLDKKRNILYCGNEQSSLPGCIGGGGQVIAIRLDPVSGGMTEISRQPSFGVNPTYIALDPSGGYLIVTHHSSYLPVTKIGKDPYGKYNIYTEFDDTTTVLFRLREDGSIGEPCDVWKHTGHGPLMDTQSNPHVHSVMLAPDGKLFAMCDKGGDRIYFFRIDYETERLVLVNDYQSLPGSSPRHSCFHPTLPYWYMNNESMAVLRAFRYGEDGALEHICTVDTLPDGFQDDPSLDKEMRLRQSDISIHPSGKYLYTLMRGANYISAFEIDQTTGALERIQAAELDGVSPRSCAFSPDGRFLLIATSGSGEILAWSVGADGKVSSTGVKTNQPSPGTLTFFQP